MYFESRESVYVNKWYSFIGGTKEYTDEFISRIQAATLRPGKMDVAVIGNNSETGKWYARLAQFFLEDASQANTILETELPLIDLDFGG